MSSAFGQPLQNTVPHNIIAIFSQTWAEKTKSIVDFFPKFHCELNPIEMFWGWMKGCVRRNCDYSFSSLEIAVPDVLNSVEPHMIRRYVRRCLRYMDAYRRHEGLIGPVLEHAMKKYSSHRRLPPDFIFDLVVEEYNMKRGVTTS